MPYFCYEARDPQGNLVVGRANGPGHLDIVLELNRVGYKVLRVWQKPPLMPGFRFWSFYGRVPLSELALFTRELSMFFSSGVGLIRGLESIGEQGFSPQTSQAALDVARGLSEGRSLSQALGLRPDVFRPVFIRLVHAGEASGALDKILSQLSSHLEKELLLKKRLQTALAYPALIFAVCILLTAFLVFFLFPLFVSFFQGLNTQLPAITRSLVSVTKVLSQPGVVISCLLAPFLLGRLYNYLVLKDSVVLWFSSFLMKLPVVGPLRRAVVLSRFCSTLSILLSSGIPQFSALKITADAMGNRVAEAAIRRVAVRVRDEGDSVAEAMGREELFPKLLVSLMLVGEEVGNLPRVLEMAFGHFEQRVEGAVAKLTALMEPLMLSFMGAVVGYVLLAVFLPVYAMLDGL